MHTSGVREKNVSNKSLVFFVRNRRAAYINTPKCNQVKGKGKIVGKDWVEKCYSDKKRYPWRRFALDKNDRRQSESEEEIDVGTESPSRVRQKGNVLSTKLLSKYS